mmetsp:Transcript_7791/g.11275  ORF Transcript_7791/g.11275 Transcript_7791/m.11275 type:complete len:214 (-) Transcript_7791:3-644(-)
MPRRSSVFTYLMPEVLGGGFVVRALVVVFFVVVVVVVVVVGVVVVVVACVVVVVVVFLVVSGAGAGAGAGVVSGSGAGAGAAFGSKVSSSGSMISAFSASSAAAAFPNRSQRGLSGRSLQSSSPMSHIFSFTVGSLVGSSRNNECQSQDGSNSAAVAVAVAEPVTGRRMHKLIRDQNSIWTEVQTIAEEAPAELHSQAPPATRPDGDLTTKLS